MKKLFNFSLFGLIFLLLGSVILAQSSPSNALKTASDELVKAISNSSTYEVRIPNNEMETFGAISGYGKRTYKLTDITLENCRMSFTIHQQEIRVVSYRDSRTIGGSTSGVPEVGPTSRTQTEDNRKKRSNKISFNLADVDSGNITIRPLENIKKMSAIVLSGRGNKAVFKNIQFLTLNLKESESESTDLRTAIAVKSKAAEKILTALINTVKLCQKEGN